MKDLDHKISRAVVNNALQNKLRIVVENLKGIRCGSKLNNSYYDSSEDECRHEYKYEYEDDCDCRWHYSDKYDLLC